MHGYNLFVNKLIDGNTFFIGNGKPSNIVFNYKLRLNFKNPSFSSQIFITESPNMTQKNYLAPVYHSDFKTETHYQQVKREYCEQN